MHGDARRDPVTYSPVSKPKALNKTPSKASTARSMRERSWETPFGKNPLHQAKVTLVRARLKENVHFSISGFV